MALTVTQKVLKEKSPKQMPKWYWRIKKGQRR